MGFSIKLDEDTARRLHERAASLSIVPEELGRRYLLEELAKVDLLDARPSKRPGETEMEFFDRMVETPHCGTLGSEKRVTTSSTPSTLKRGLKAY